MTRWIAATALAAALIPAVSTTAHDSRHQCSTRTLAGRWLFATEVGQFPAFGGDITAMGTMSIARDGTLSGTFDATVATVTFLPNVTYTGSVTLGGDCRGTLQFVTSEGIARTDSIVVPSPYEFWGMSQDPGNLWTYRARRISR